MRTTRNKIRSQVDRTGKLIRTLLATLVLAAAAAVGAVVPAEPASAWTYGYVYFSLPTWQGNCNWGQLGRVTNISGAVDNVSSVSQDRGDDLVYMRVRLNDYNQVSFTAFCDKWPGSWQAGFGQTVRPTRNNQTVWVGPAGVRYN